MSARSKIEIGHRFGQLTVKSETSKRKRGAKIWICLCSCGKYIEVKTDYLQQGWTKSCGCLRSTRARNRLPEVWSKNPKKIKNKMVYKFNTLLSSYKYNALRRKLEFLLTDSQIYSLVCSNCHYCGYKPIFERENIILSKNCQSYSECYNGIDRKNREIGYKIDNVVACCKICNIAKNKMSYEQFNSYIERLIMFRGKNVTI